MCILTDMIRGVSHIDWRQLTSMTSRWYFMCWINTFAALSSIITIKCAWEPGERAEVRARIHHNSTNVSEGSEATIRQNKRLGSLPAAWILFSGHYATTPNKCVYQVGPSSARCSRHLRSSSSQPQNWIDPSCKNLNVDPNQIIPQAGLQPSDPLMFPPSQLI